MIAGSSPGSQSVFGADLRRRTFPRVPALVTDGKSRGARDHVERLVVLLVPVGRWPVRMRWDGEHRNPEAVGGTATVFDHAHLDRAEENHFATLGSNDRRLRHVQLRVARVDFHQRPYRINAGCARRPS